MNEPWFNPAIWGWLPGTVFGTSVGMWGSLAGYLAQQGRGRKFVLGVGWAFFGVALVLLAGGMVAWSTGQPAGVWYGRLFPASWESSCCPSSCRRSTAGTKKPRRGGWKPSTCSLLRGPSFLDTCCAAVLRLNSGESAMGSPLFWPIFRRPSVGRARGAGLGDGLV